MAQRRLVKSPPELWAEVSSEDALARRLEQFGEIRITRVEPETTVAWEGERASGTVQLEPAGWGTKVTLTAAPAPATVVPPRPQEPTPGLFARFLRRCPRPGDQLAAAAAPDPGPPAPGPEPPPPAPGPAPTAAEPAAAAPGGEPHSTGRATDEILADVLDALGAARHRPFSRE